jgi:hypothetical protein
MSDNGAVRSDLLLLYSALNASTGLTAAALRDGK